MAKTPAQSKAAIKAIDALKSSRGWAIISETMREELIAAAMEIANKQTMGLDEINFRRGAIWAAGQLAYLPERLIQAEQTNIALAPHSNKDDAEA